MNEAGIEALQGPLCGSNEPWMGGTHSHIHVLQRAVVHALEHAEMDAERWAFSLSDEAMFHTPGGLPSVAFHLRHMARSLDRLLTYAEGRQLTEQQFHGLESEYESAPAAEVVAEFSRRFLEAKVRVLNFEQGQFEEARGVGRKRLPSTVGGLLIHCAEHTQRHSGQMVTTSKVLRARLG
jgi:uncharacterized damage-inducible protein DinB